MPSGAQQAQKLLRLYLHFLTELHDFLQKGLTHHDLFVAAAIKLLQLSVETSQPYNLQGAACMQLIKGYTCNKECSKNSEVEIVRNLERELSCTLKLLMSESLLKASKGSTMTHMFSRPPFPALLNLEIRTDVFF